MSIKFKVNLSPVRSDVGQLVVSKQGAALVINHNEFDFSFLNDGDTLPHSAITGSTFCQDVIRNGEVIDVTLRLPHAHDAPESVRFPQPILVEQDGPITMPGGTNAD